MLPMQRLPISPPLLFLKNSSWLYGGFLMGIYIASIEKAPAISGWGLHTKGYISVRTRQYPRINFTAFKRLYVVALA